MKLNPESTTVVHCAGGNPGEEKSWPYGIKDAAGDQKRIFRAQEKDKNEKQSTWMIHFDLLTSTAIIGTEFVFLKNHLVINILYIGQVEIRLSDEKRGICRIDLV